MLPALTTGQSMNRYSSMVPAPHPTALDAYDWDFGDGSTGSGAMPNHIYTTDGNFTVTLTVTDDAGDTGTDTTTATIGLGNQAPIADADNPYNGTVSEPLQFDGSGSSDPDGAIVAYDWDFGDGSTGTDVMPTHTYAVVGLIMSRLR